MTKVRNIKGTSDNRCKCGSWLSHYEKYSKSKAIICSEITCKSKEVLGAHVQKVGAECNHWFIVPLCSAHNNSTEEFYICKTSVLVSANITITCSNN